MDQKHNPISRIMDREHNPISSITDHLLVDAEKEAMIPAGRDGNETKNTSI